jgi:hypothetical protein
MSMLSVLGDGVDEFSVRTADLQSTIIPFMADGDGLMTAVAILSTGVCAVWAFRRVVEWIRGPGDAGAFVQHLGRRPDGTGASWGVVRDGQTAAPLPLARVSILDGTGHAMARTIADVRGRFGFPISQDELIRRGGFGVITVAKDGYYEHTVRHPVVAGAHRVRADFALMRRPNTVHTAVRAASAGWRVGATILFWTSVVTVPVAAMKLGTTYAGILIALFAFSAIVRAVESRAARSHIR